MIDERLAGVLPLDRLEGGHAVGDGLDAGHGRAAGGEGVEDEQDRRGTRGLEPAHRVLGDHVLEPTAEDGLEHAGDDHQEHGDDEEVGRDGEDLPGLLDAAQVADGDDGDEGEGDRAPGTGTGGLNAPSRARRHRRRPTPPR